MSLTLSPDNQEYIDRAIGTGEFANEQALLNEAVTRMRLRFESLAAIQEGLAQAERGEGLSLEEAREKLLREYQVNT